MSLCLAEPLLQRIASTFPDHSLQSCRGMRRMRVTFTYFISGKCMLIWGLYLFPKDSHFKDIGVESFHKQGKGSGKKPQRQHKYYLWSSASPIKYCAKHDVYKYSRALRMDCSAGRQDGLSNMLYSKTAAQLQTWTILFWSHFCVSNKGPNAIVLVRKC